MKKTPKMNLDQLKLDSFVTVGKKQEDKVRGGAMAWSFYPYDCW